MSRSDIREPFRLPEREHSLPYCLAIKPLDSIRPCWGCPDERVKPHVHCWMGTDHIHYVDDPWLIVPVPEVPG